MQHIVIPAVIVGSLGLLAAAMLYTASKIFHTRENPLVKKIEALLPGANCGACGYPGCSGFAEAMANEQNPELVCPVAPAETMKQIGELVGLALGQGGAKKAVLLCQGSNEAARKICEYHGIKDCLSASLLFGGDKACQYACFGLGTCVEVCPFGAISLTDGIVTIDEQTCTGCGKCVPACPRNVLALRPAGHRVLVACRSKDKGGQTRKNCKKGCIGCRKCVKACEFDAITMDGALARIDDSKCTRCGACVQACPTGAIVAMNQQKEEAV